MFLVLCVMSSFGLNSGHCEYSVVWSLLCYSYHNHLENDEVYFSRQLSRLDSDCKLCPAFFGR